jgi:hypothetical protein
MNQRTLHPEELELRALIWLLEQPRVRHTLVEVEVALDVPQGSLRPCIERYGSILKSCTTYRLLDDSTDGFITLEEDDIPTAQDIVANGW